MEFDAKHSIITPEGVFIIGTYDENGVPNAMNAAWGQQSDYGEITLFLAKHKTTDNVKKTKAFTVAFATKDTVVISDYFAWKRATKSTRLNRPASMSTRRRTSMRRSSKNIRSLWNVK